MTGQPELEVFWVALTAIASVITAIATVFASVIIFFARKQLRFDAWIKAQEIYTNETFLKARTELFKCLDDKEATCTVEQAMEVCRRMDELAHLARFLGKCMVLKYWGRPLAQAWHLLGVPLVKKERELTKNPAKWEAFEKLGEKALKAHPDVKSKPSATFSGSFEVLFTV